MSMQTASETMAGLVFLVLLACLAALGNAQSTDIKVVSCTTSLISALSFVCQTPKSDPASSAVGYDLDASSVCQFASTSINAYMSYTSHSMLGSCVRSAAMPAAGARPGGVGAVLRPACGGKPDERSGRHGAGRRPATPA